MQASEKKLKDYQLDGAQKMLQFLAHNGSVYCADEMGCIDGECTVKINRARLCRTYKLKDLFIKFHTTFDRSIPTYTRSFNETTGRVQLHKIRDVLFQGFKPVITILTANEKVIATPDHEILTEKGWKAAGKITKKDRIAVENPKATSKALSRLENLELLTVLEHAKIHGKVTNFNQGEIAFKKVKEIINRKHKSAVYDIVCEDPHRNFSCNNVIVHNCGKSATAIEAFNHLPVDKLIIISPKVGIYSWEQELKDWMKKDLRVTVFEKTKEVTSGDIQNTDIVILSYETVRKVWKLIAKHMQGAVLVMDEAHYLKNRKAKRTKAVIGDLSKHEPGLWDYCSFRIALSGTPFKQNVVDGFTMFNRMAPHLFPSFLDFAGRYSYARATPYAIAYSGIRNAPELKELIRNNFYFRRTKAEVLPELPSKIFQPIYLGKEFSAPVPKTKKEKVEQEILSIYQKLRGEKQTSVTTLTLAGERRIQGEMKCGAVAEFVIDLLEQDLPVVIGAHHTNVISKLAELLKDYKPVIIDGDTPAKQRFENVKAFQEGKTNLFIGQFVAAGVNVTLTRSSTMVLAEPSYDPAELAQFIARCNRIGSTEILIVYYFLVVGSIDMQIVETVMRKVEEFEQVV